MDAITQSDSLLTIDRIYASGEFRQDYERSIQWIEDGKSYVTIEETENGADELIKYDSKTQKRSTYVAASKLKTTDSNLSIEDFSLSPDGSKVMIFTNSSRVWRSNTKGDYWVYDFNNSRLSQVGKNYPSSSLMFAKFSADNKYVAYVHDFNVYKEDFKTGAVIQLTNDGSREIINGTFDWAYEEEFGKRDGFSWSPDGNYIAYWQIDASDVGTHYMINNTDSVYAQPIPLQYPKVGEKPSAAKVGIVSADGGETYWLPLVDTEDRNYIPGMQWVNKDLLLIQQMNRKQNELNVWAYIPSAKTLHKVYEEREDTWIELQYPDISSNGWGNNDLPIVDGGKAFLRMTENDAWRHVYKVNIRTGKKTLITTGDYDVASMSAVTDRDLYFMASPDNSTQRYLYHVDVSGKDTPKRITTNPFSGVNNYNISPDGKFAVHVHQSTVEPRTVRFISLTDHKTIKTVVDNQAYKDKLKTLALPEIEFSKVTTAEGLDIDVRMIYPVGFDSSKKYPVIFHVYGEPWGQVATDQQVGLWNIMMAQKGYVIVDMDNRGTPCLKGSAWRKSIYRKVGVINALDQSQAATELLKLPYLDADRTAVWGWSGGGSMTLNLLFQYPEIYKTGISVAPVTNQLIYDNIYQERYMGLPQENMEDFIAGSPITYAKNLTGNLLLVHGTGDDNVHYQGAEMLINELITHNKQFQVMPYPNRSHGIYEGANTRRHLYTMMTNYILAYTPVNGKNRP